MERKELKTAADWKEVEEAMGPVFYQKFEVDGYNISLSLAHLKPTKVKLAVYVNGWMRGEWVTTDCEERRRFMYHYSSYVWPYSLRKGYKTKRDRAWAEKRGLFKKTDVYSSFFPSFTAFKRQIVKNNSQIVWIKEHWNG